MTKPLCFVDLDDTLFQTQAKMEKHVLSDPFCVAAVTQEGLPRSFMTQEQHHFFEWLLSSTHLIPVTARSTEELSLVELEFKSWRIASHGGIIITPSGEVEPVWRNEVMERLERGYSADLKAMAYFLTEILSGNPDMTVTLHTEYGNKMPIYLSLKSQEGLSFEMAEVLRGDMYAEFDIERFYTHHNENNLHWIPNCVGKGSAVRYLLEILKGQFDHSPVLGFADSISDYDFLRYCSWFGYPAHSQLAALIEDTVGSR
jgi:hydroxymethylpyrimidine pyrophosphatase-like HAD family hydrolase